MTKYTTLTATLALTAFLFGCPSDEPQEDDDQTADDDDSQPAGPPSAGSVGTCVPFEPYAGYTTCVMSEAQAVPSGSRSRREGENRDLPASIDHTPDLDGCLDVHDQGQCGWCVAHATTAAMEALLCRGAWPYERISEPHLWYLGSGQAPFGGCEGGWQVSAAFGILAEETEAGNDLVPGSIWPFEADANAMNESRPADQQLQDDGRYGASESQIGEVSFGDVEAIKSALAEGHDVVYSVPVFKDTGWSCWEDFWACLQFWSNPEGTIDIPDPAPPGMCRCSCEEDGEDCTECPEEDHCLRGYHAILVVGYDDAEDGRFQFLNSWGDGWGDGGYGTISYDMISEYGRGGRFLSQVEVDAGDDDDATGDDDTTGGIDADGDGWTVEDGDCNDDAPLTFPGAAEQCDGLDNDCNEVVPDEEVDADGDGMSTCQGDCNDQDATVYEGAEEACDGFDNDCDGLVDDDEADVDGDGYMACDGDCDNGDSAIYPGAVETCNAVDDDCDQIVDNGFDLDGDTYTICGADGLHGTEDDDCDDADPERYPTADETCDGVDNDCDALVDDDDGDYIPDYDGDGQLGDLCGGVDCDDLDPFMHDDDDDGDGFSPCMGDEDDGNDNSYPGAAEICDGLDNDFDGTIDEFVEEDWILVTGQSNYKFYEIDPTDASSSQVSNMSQNYAICSLDVWGGGWSIASNGAGGSLYLAEVCSGDITPIGQTGMGSICGISFGPDRRLFGLDRQNDILVEFDTDTGAGTAVGSLGFDLGYNGMAYDCTSETLYGLDAMSNQLFKVDPDTGLAYDFVPFNINFDQVGLEFDHVSSLLLASTGSDLYEIDPQTGTTNHIGSFSLNDVNDLAFHPPCP